MKKRLFATFLCYVCFLSATVGNRADSIGLGKLASQCYSWIERKGAQYAWRLEETLLSRTPAIFFETGDRSYSVRDVLALTDDELEEIAKRYLKLPEDWEALIRYLSDPYLGYSPLQAERRFRDRFGAEISEEKLGGLNVHFNFALGMRLLATREAQQNWLSFKPWHVLSKLTPFSEIEYRDRRVGQVTLLAGEEVQRRYTTLLTLALRLAIEDSADWALRDFMQTIRDTPHFRSLYLVPGAAVMSPFAQTLNARLKGTSPAQYPNAELLSELFSSWVIHWCELARPKDSPNHDEATTMVAIVFELIKYFEERDETKLAKFWRSHLRPILYHLENYIWTTETSQQLHSKLLKKIRSNLLPLG